MGAFRIIALLFLLFGWTSPVRAQSLKTAVAAENSPDFLDCPRSAALLQAVELILERPLENVLAGDAAVSVEVRFFKEAGEYRARLLFHGKQSDEARLSGETQLSGERQLSDSSADCAPLAEAVSVTIALFFDQEFPRETPAHLRSAEPAPAEEAAPLAPPSAHPIIRAQAMIGVAFGMGAQPSALLGGEVNIAFGGLQLGASIEAVTPSSVPLEPGSVSTKLLFATLHGCYVWGKRWAIGPCAFVGAGLMRGTGRGYEQEASDALWWTALGPGLVFRGPLGASERFFWGARGALWIPTQSQEFSVENVGTAWESPALQGTLLGNLGLRLW